MLVAPIINRMTGYQHIPHGFEPVFDERSRVLVLGSFPSALSRANDFYYGNPRNRFWRVMARVLGEPVPADEDIPAKRRLLLAYGVALWDVVQSCDVRGSSDASIKNVVPVDVARITAGRLYHRWLEPQSGLAAQVLPSTSPANAAWGEERLAAAWSEALSPLLP